MAKTISDEQMKLTMIINGNSAQKELFDLEKSTRSLNEQNKSLLLQKKLLEKQGQKDTEQYKLLTATIKSNTAEVANNKNRMDELQKEIGLTGLTMGQLQSKATMLRNTLRNLIPGSADYVRYQAELTQVNARLGELSGRSRTAQASIGSLADGFNRYQGMALAAVAALTGVVLSIQKIIDINGKLSEAQSDVRKTTGMTALEVDELTKSFGLLQTRTSRINLLGIAEQGGKIGIAKSDILDFVGVMNKASVSLGDSFTGGVEEVANKLGKIKFLFQETKDLNVDQAYNSIGSAINDLGANGVASEANIADFTTRIGSLTDVLKPTIQQTLALGTAFEESGIESEVSARAYGIFMKQASTETAKFAKVMNLTQGEVESMINTNPLEFMLKFSEGMKGMNATDTAKTLDSLGISADGANKVIGAMGNNTARFRELIDLSNNSFASGTSLINEYNIKNNNLAATLEKISKTVSGWFSSETFIKWLAGAVEWLGKFIGATEDADGQAKGFRNLLILFTKTLIVLVSSYISYNAALKFTAYWSKTVEGLQSLLNVANGRGKFISDLLRASTLYLSYAYNSLAGNTMRANAAMKLINTTVKISPLGILLTTAIALGVAFFAFRKNADDAANSIKKVSSETKLADEITKNLNSNFSKASTELKSKIEPLISILNNQNVSLETRKKAYEKLITISPEFVGTVDKEFRATDKLKTVYTDLLAKMQEKMRFESMKSVLQSKYDEEAKALDKLMTAETNAAKEKAKLDRIEKEIAKSKQGGRIAFIRDDYNKSQEELEAAQKNYATAQKNITVVEAYRTKQVEALTNQQKKLTKDSKEWIAIQVKINSLIGSQTVSDDPNAPKFNPMDNGDKGDKSSKTLADKNKKFLEDAKKFEEDKLKIQREAEDDRLANLPQGYAKENELEQVLFDRKISDLKAQLVKEEDIKLAFNNASNPKLSEAERSLWKSKAELWVASNKANNSKIESATQMHNTKLGIIEEKAAKDRLDKEQEQYDLEKMQRETAFNNEINALNLSDAEKKKRQDAFDKNELRIAKAHIADKIVLLKAALAEGLFSPEVQAKMEKQLVFLENAASKIADVSEPGKKSKTETIGDAAKSAFGETDILGYTPSQWTSAFDNLDSLEGKLEAVGMVVQGMQNLWAVFANYQNASDAAQLQKFEKNSDAKKTKLKKQLDSGVLSQKNYDKQVSKIDEELENKKADLDYKRAKREKAMALVGAIISTAKGIATALPNLILAGIAAVVGGLQIATIAKQPLPAKGHEEGLYQDYVTREQDGKKFKSSYGGKTRSGLVSKTSHFLVAENGPEMVIDNKAWRQMNPEVKDSLIRELRGIKGFEQGLYNQDKMRIEVPAASTPSSNNDTQMLTIMMSLVAENTAVLKDLRDNGVVGKFFRNDLKSMKEVEQGIKDYNDLRTKSKK